GSQAGLIERECNRGNLVRSSSDVEGILSRKKRKIQNPRRAATAVGRGNKYGRPDGSATAASWASRLLRPEADSGPAPAGRPPTFAFSPTASAPSTGLPRWHHPGRTPPDGRWRRGSRCRTPRSSGRSPGCRPGRWRGETSRPPRGDTGHEPPG